MTATLLEDDRIKSRCKEFRREASRTEFLGQHSDRGLEIADCGLESRSQALPGNEITRGSASAAPPVTAQLASSPNEAEPRVSGFSGGAWEPDYPPCEDAAPPQSAIPNPQSAIDSAAELLADPKVRQALGGKNPSRRNREIFRAVVVAHRCQRDVAKEFGVSQPRVSQIVQQVTRWLSENVVEQDRPHSGLAQILIAENLLRMQYDHLYATALDLLHGRTSGTPAGTDAKIEKQDQPQPPHKPNAAFLNTAVRVVNSRAKFEGLIGRPVQRAMNEASWRKVSEFGPMNDGLKPDHPQKHEEDGSYNPLSTGDQPADEPAQTAQQVSEGFREAYKRYAAWFPGDFSARAAYYRTQTERAFGPPLEDEDLRDLEMDHIKLIHEWDLLAAKAHSKATELTAAQPPETSPDRFAALRRVCLIELLKRGGGIRCDDDADGLLDCLEYDTASGRFGWDLRFMELAGGSQDLPK